MRDEKTWVLVGDASRARLFLSDGKGVTLQQEFDHPESRAFNHELVSDRPGRVQQSAPPSRGNGAAGPAKGSRSAMEPHTMPKAVEHEHFAHELAAVLHRGLLDHAYQRLVLVAAPGFLGLLRGNLDAQVEKHVCGTLDKDLTHLPERDVVQRLQPLLGAA